MNIYCEPGSKVVFTGEGGYPRDAAFAQEKLTIGTVYTVEEIVIEDWSTTVYLEEVKGGFNSVLFEDWE